MAQILTMAVMKGGTGKTTTCAALAQAASSKGKSVLCIDLDAQANLTRILGADPTGPGAFELLQGGNAGELIQRTAGGIDVIAASLNLSDEDHKKGNAYALETALTPLKRKYSLIIIDTPPRLCDVTYNALQAATGLIIPLEADLDSLKGLYHIIDVANMFKQGSNPKLKILGCIITRYSKQSKFNRYIREQIKDNAKANGCELLAEIRQGVAVKECYALQANLFEYAPRSNPAIDYMSLYEKLF